MYFLVAMTYIIGVSIAVIISIFCCGVGVPLLVCGFVCLVSKVVNQQRRQIQNMTDYSPQAQQTLSHIPLSAVSKTNNALFPLGPYISTGTEYTFNKLH